MILSHLLRKSFLAILIAPALLVADSVPLAFALTRDLQLPAWDRPVHGLSLTLFDVTHDAGLVGIGIALGGQDVSVSEVDGIQISGIMNASGDVNGLQIAGLVNMARSFRGSMISGFVNIGGAYGTRYSSGLQLALFSNSVEFMESGKEGRTSLLDGAQISLGLNRAHHLRGIQASTLGNEATQCLGLQVGLVNYAEELHGIQMGLYNRAISGVGIQIGLINNFGAGEDSLWLPFVNGRF